jgi:hypothetical protein
MFAWTLSDLGDGVACEARVQVNNIFDTLYAAYGEGAEFFVAAGRHAFFDLSVTF